MVDRINTEGQSFTQLRHQLLEKFHDHKDNGHRQTDAIRFHDGEIYVKKGVTNGWAGSKKRAARNAKYEAVQTVLKNAINTEFGSKRLNGDRIGDAVFNRLGKMDKIDYYDLNRITQKLTEVLKEADQGRTGDARVRAEQVHSLFVSAENDEPTVGNENLQNWKRIVDMHSTIREAIISDLRQSYPGSYDNDDVARLKAQELMQKAGIDPTDEFNSIKYHKLIPVMTDPSNFPGHQEPPKSGWLRAAKDPAERRNKARMNAQLVLSLNNDIGRKALRTPSMFRRLPRDVGLRGSLRQSEAEALAVIHENTRRAVEGFTRTRNSPQGGAHAKLFQQMRGHIGNIRQFAYGLTIDVPKGQLPARKELQRALLKQAIVLEDMALSLHPSTLRGIPVRPQMNVGLNPSDTAWLLNHRSGLHELKTGDLDLQTKVIMPGRKYNLVTDKAEDINKTLGDALRRVNTALDEFTAKGTKASDSQLAKLSMAVEDASRANDDLLRETVILYSYKIRKIDHYKALHPIKTKLGLGGDKDLKQQTSELQTAHAKLTHNAEMLRNLRAMISLTNDQRNVSQRLPAMHPLDERARQARMAALGVEVPKKLVLSVDDVPDYYSSDSDSDTDSHTDSRQKGSTILIEQEKPVADHSDQKTDIVSEDALRAGLDGRADDEISLFEPDPEADNDDVENQESAARPVDVGGASDSEYSEKGRVDWGQAGVTAGADESLYGPPTTDSDEEPYEPPSEAGDVGAPANQAAESKASSDVSLSMKIGPQFSRFPDFEEPAYGDDLAYNTIDDDAKADTVEKAMRAAAATVSFRRPDEIGDQVGRVPAQDGATLSDVSEGFGSEKGRDDGDAVQAAQNTAAPTGNLDPKANDSVEDDDEYNPYFSASEPDDPNDEKGRVDGDAAQAAQNTAAPTGNLDPQVNDSVEDDDEYNPDLYESEPDDSNDKKVSIGGDAKQVAEDTAAVTGAVDQQAAADADVQKLDDGSDGGSLVDDDAKAETVEIANPETDVKKN